MAKSSLLVVFLSIFEIFLLLRRLLFRGKDHFSADNISSECYRDSLIDTEYIILSKKNKQYEGDIISVV